MAIYRPLNPDFYKSDLNPADKNRLAIEAGYTGTEDALNNANKIREGGGGTNAGMGATTALPVAPTIDLQSIYKTLYDQSGISNLQAKADSVSTALLKKEEAKNRALEVINDNPFYSEGRRTGRAAKVEGAFANDKALSMTEQALVTNQIASKKADIETQLNLATKQFDINSTAANTALNQFNSLLSSGALNNLSDADIANLTSSTGLSSSMIRAAVDAQKQKNIQTSAVSFDDGTNQGFVLYNSQSGEIIKKQNVAASKPNQGRQPTASELQQQQVSIAKEAAQKGATVSQMFSLFSGILDPDLIYQIYNSNSKYGPDKGDIKALEKYGVSQGKALSPTDQYFSQFVKN